MELQSEESRRRMEVDREKTEQRKEHEKQRKVEITELLAELESVKQVLAQENEKKENRIAECK